MPRTRAEAGGFRTEVQQRSLTWLEVHREANPRRRSDSDVVYHGVEASRGSSEGYRVLWYRSSQKEEQDRQSRQGRLERARTRLEDLRTSRRRGVFATAEEARTVGQRILDEEQVQDWLTQARAGRPGPKTTYRRVEDKQYRIRLEEDGQALKREALCDGLFPLMTNDKSLSLAEALGKYKYQPFVEKRHEQLKTVFGVAPVWLKNVERVSSLLWLYYVVELVQALVERETRRRMEQEGITSLALYPERRASSAPTAELVLGVLEGHRRHRLVDEDDVELRRFHDDLSEAAQETLRLLDVNRVAYGLE